MYPALYHAHHRRHLEDLPFWRWLASNNPGPILELGCGTGRVLLSLAKSGDMLVGLDHNHAMLRFFQGQFTQENRNQVHLIQSDFTQFHLATRFKSIMLPCNTISTLSPLQIQAMLSCVRAHLDPTGVFAASMPNPYWLESLPGYAEAEVEEDFPHPLDGEPVQVSSAWYRDGRIFTVSWYYDHLLPDGKVDRLQASVCHQLTTTDQYLQIFHQAGFEKVTCYGDFHRRKYRKSSQYLIMIASPGI